ncbi:adenosine kinase [Simiduia curdlanivorans]|uniref:Adenosine kinase n=1 Tax=Simiduia curdlanivorans TaxID=1492769 RepID=A0ABV8V5C2_9GAMM|nr:adenosine kinase [Simiduia curdlanivorans]MDN3638370.1 adenosine kinase [Simiduia curdlanivorans]
MTHFDIYGIGAALVDTEIQASDQQLQDWGIEKGVMTLVDEARQNELLAAMGEHLLGAARASGGSAANTIIGASYLGAACAYACRVADDDNGHFYLRDMKDAGVHIPQGANTQLPEGVSGKCLVIITPDAERTMNTFLGASEKLSTEDIDIEALKQARYVYIEGYLVTSETGRPAAIHARQTAEQAGVKTALSLSDPAMVKFFRAGLADMIGEKVDLLFCNLEEALGFTETNTIAAATQALKQYARAFAITLGAEGALLFDGEKDIKVAGHPAKAIDTNGAGDMFAGAFLFGLSQNWSFEKAGDLANKAAAQVVSQYGPRLTASQYRALL